MTRKKKLLIAGGILAAGAGVAALLIALRSDPPREAPPPQSPLVQTVDVDARQGALEVTGSGTVRPRAEVALAPQVSGRVVYVAPSLVSGGRVRQGETLVRLEQADYRNRVEQALAGVEQQRVSVLQADEEVRIARAEYERFQARQQRRADNAFAGIDADDYAARVTSGEAASGRAAPDTTGVSSSALLFREPQLDAAQAALESAQAQLEDARLALGRTTIQAPFDGVVRSEAVDRGSYVAPGQTLAQLYAADLVEVVVPLSQEEAALLPELWALRAGQSGAGIPAQVFADYGPFRYRWDGYVDRAEAALDEATRTINAVVRVPQPFGGGQRVGRSALGTDTGDAEAYTLSAPPLLVGQFVEVRMEGAQFDRYLVVPRRALRRGDEVWAVEQDSLLRIVPVQVLQKNDSDVLVLAPQLQAGQAVVTSDLNAVTDGMTVRLASAVRQDTTRSGGASAAR